MASRKYDVNTTHTEGVSDLLRSPHPSPQGAGNKIDSLLPRLHTLLKQAPPASPELRQLLHLIEDRYLKQVPRSRPLESALDAITYYGDNELAVDVLRKKYLAPGEKGPLHLWDRVARAIASVEKDPAYWYEKFLSILVDFKFVPGGRVMHGAGREDARRRPTLSNCYVIPIEEDSLEGIYQCLTESAMVYRTGGGVGCIRKDALVLTQAGVQKIQEVQAGDQVLSFNMVSGKFEWKPVEKVHEFLVENQDNIKIVFNDYSYIITSFWHPTLVYNRGDFGYKRADQLQVGDLTLTPKREFWYASSYHDPDLGWALGAYLGDGCAYLSHKRVYQNDYKGLGKQRFAYRLQFAGDSREVIERFVEIINTYCGLHVQPHQSKRRDYQSPVYEVSTNAYSLHKFLELTDWQTGRKCYTLHIPQRIWRASEETALAFIAGLIDTDGGVDDRRGRITYASVSRTMVEGLQALISLLGGQASVHGKKREGTSTSSGISNRKDVYELSLYADDIILKILPYLRHSEKRRRLERILEKVYLKGRVYTLPDDCVTFILRFPATRVLSINSSAVSALRHGRRTLSSRLFTRMMENIIQHEETTPADRHLARFYLNLIPQLREIKSLQRGIEDTTEFYDFTIPDNNNYVAGFGNFYVVHNTDLSILRPEGAPVNATIDKSPGATAFMNLFSESTNTVSQAGRRGALMLTLRVDHPDIEKFIHIKNDPLRMKVQYANISVLLTHLFMEKVAAEHDPTRQQEICFELEDEQGNRQNVFARPDEEIEYEGKIWTAEALYRHLRTNKPSTNSESSPAKTNGGAHGSGSGVSV